MTSWLDVLSSRGVVPHQDEMDEMPHQSGPTRVEVEAVLECETWRETVEFMQKVKDLAYIQFEPSDLSTASIIDQPEGTTALAAAHAC